MLLMMAWKEPSLIAAVYLNLKVMSVLTRSCGLVGHKLSIVIILILFLTWDIVVRVLKNTGALLAVCKIAMRSNACSQQSTV